MGKNKAWGIWARGVLAIACSILPMTLLAQNPAPMTCAVSDFRRIALTVGNPTERVESAEAWLDQRGSLCNINQLNLIQSNLATWLGAALTGEITVMVEALQEQLLAKDPGKLKELFNPEVKTFTPTKEVTTNPTPRPPIVNANPAPGVAVLPAVPAVGVLVPPPGSAPTEDPTKSKFPPARFSDEQRIKVKAFFEALRKDTVGCPLNLKPLGDLCVSEKPRNWRVGSKLAAPIVPSEVPAKMAELLGPPSEGHKYAMVNEDILLFNTETKEITDLMVDQGGQLVRKPEALDAQFASEQKTAIKKYFTDNLKITSPNTCPDNMKPVDGSSPKNCVSTRTRTWKLGEPIPLSLKPTDLPPALSALLGLPKPGYQYKLLNEDILIIQASTNRIAAALMDYGGITEKAP